MPDAKKENLVDMAKIICFVTGKIGTSYVIMVTLQGLNLVFGQMLKLPCILVRTVFGISRNIWTLNGPGNTGPLSLLRNRATILA